MSVKDVLKELRQKGWDIVKGRKHIKAYHPKGGFVSISATPSCPYAEKHIRGDVKRLEREHDGTQETV